MQSTSIEALVLLAVVIAACETDDVNHPVRRVLGKKLGAGWAHEIATARSHAERLNVLQRRLTFTPADSLHRDDEPSSVGNRHDHLKEQQ